MITSKQISRRGKRLNASTTGKLVLKVIVEGANVEDLTVSIRLTLEVIRIESDVIPAVRLNIKKITLSQKVSKGSFAFIPSPVAPNV